MPYTTFSLGPDNLKLMEIGNAQQQAIAQRELQKAQLAQSADQFYQNLWAGDRALNTQRALKEAELAAQQEQFSKTFGAKTAQQEWQNKQWLDLLAQRKEGASGTIGKVEGLLNDYISAFSSAKSDNEKRYSQMLGLVDQTSGQQAADIRSEYGQQSANMMQNLARTGMANTTVAPTLKAGIQREQSASLNRLADQMLQTKLGVIGSKKDYIPDYSPFTSAFSNIYGTDTSNYNAAMAALSNLKF